MGSPPPPNFPAPSVGVALAVPATPAAKVCGFEIGLPRLAFGISIFLGGLGFPPKIPLPWVSFRLKCSLSDPIDASGGLAFGGGRTPNGEPDADLQEDAA